LPHKHNYAQQQWGHPDTNQKLYSETPNLVPKVGTGKAPSHTPASEVKKRLIVTEQGQIQDFVKGWGAHQWSSDSTVSTVQSTSFLGDLGACLPHPPGNFKKNALNYLIRLCILKS